MNRRPSGYEPDELPDCSTPRQYQNKMGGEGFEPSKLSQQIYSLPPLTTRESTQKLYLFLKKKKADDRTRTDNLLITSQLLCQLSHIGILDFGNHLLSQAASHQVPSTVWVLTVVFGMGTGVSPKRIVTKNLNDPCGIRTRVTAVKGRCLNPLTNGPYYYSPSRIRTNDPPVNSRMLYR